MQWITREKPKIDRLACPWLIRRFIDAGAEIIYVPVAEVLPAAARTGATPFDVPGVEFSHYGPECTFGYFLKKYDLRDPALHALAPIIRGADTDNHALAQQAAGLWAISAGLAYNISPTTSSSCSRAWCFTMLSTAGPITCSTKPTPSSPRSSFWPRCTPPT